VPARTAALFFDAQNVSLHPKDPAAQRFIDEIGIVGRLAAAVKAFREAGCTIVYAQADHRPDHADVAPLVIGMTRDWRLDEHVDDRRRSTAGSWEAEIIPEIAPRPGDYVVKKHRWSAFFQTPLELSLRTRGIDTLILAGGVTEIGIASTAYAARDLDLNQIFLRDATFSIRPQVHAMFMDEILPRLGRVMTVDEAVARIAR
jgi:ureidoacrylate peracid hydrolase